VTELAGFDRERLNHAVGLVKQGCAKGAYPGAVVLIERGGVKVVHEAIGFTSYAPGAQPTTVDTVYDVASMTKPIATASAVLRLVELGEVNLDDPIARYLPEVGAAITVRQLLTHTSGLVADAPLWKTGEGGRADCAAAAMALTRPEALESAPGSAVRYSCIGFILLGLMVEAVTSEGLDSFVGREVFDKLQMTQTGFYTVNQFAERARVALTERRTAVGLGRDFWARLVDSGRYLDLHTPDSVAHGAVHDENALAMGGVSGNAGLFSTARDVAKFARMYLAGGAVGERPGLDGRAGRVQVLSPAVIELATTNHTAGLGENRGLGWFVNTPGTFFGNLLSPKAYGHTGFTGTAVWVDPVRELIVVLLTNRVHETRENLALISLRPRFINAVVAAIA
jgi:CubicO group peptidase (beta-lactamase class C family)